MYNYIYIMKYVHTCSYIPLSLQNYFLVIEIIIIMWKLKIIKRVIFILFVLEKNQIWRNVKKLMYNYI